MVVVEEMGYHHPNVANEVGEGEGFPSKNGVLSSCYQDSEPAVHSKWLMNFVVWEGLALVNELFLELQYYLYDEIHENYIDPLAGQWFDFRIRLNIQGNFDWYLNLH